MVFDLAAVRADTPGCLDQVFLDSAGSSLPPRPVLDAVIGHLRREAEIGGYRAGDDADLDQGYPLFAELLGCEPDEVAFTDGATRSWLTAFAGLDLGPDDRVLVTEVEYGGTAIPLLNAGARIEVVPSTPDGEVDVDALRGMLDERVKLVSLVHVPTNGGLVNPVREVVAAAHEVGALVFLDACQSVGQVPVSAAETGVDVITGAGRKWLRGPRGTGFLVVRAAARDRLRPRLPDLHGGEWTDTDQIKLREDARVFELWENSVANRLGLYAAARYLLDLGVDVVAAEVAARAERLRAGLAELPGVTVHDLGKQRCGIVTFSKVGTAADELRDRLRQAGVTVTVSRRSSTRFDMTRRGLESMVRASPHYFVSDEQIDRAVELVGTV
ncbi:aminotransferase class V-fold PLP-dependent enzyme [Actinokineospora fastidiosa]|uniref:Probable hercynylcysteine sulfoxide lyase n=1 Tax=Actinokineospora fastidiosa TaxID=1816 RepID=A0A918GI03_9PSEU|nr:aminotransferase class V-fold PLP-dependent enzyme [Actinokineospora fastidiosa]GGS38022.1 aminotransferase class V [Actinokineospora fastidiosa]